MPPVGAYSMVLGHPSNDSGFGIDNLPYGVFSDAVRSPRVGVRIGDEVLDIAELLRDHDGLAEEHVLQLEAAWKSPSLNAFLSLGRDAWDRARAWLRGVVGGAAGYEHLAPHRTPISQVQLHLPFDVADYIDFNASECHASNAAQILRPHSPGLAENWRRLPVGYHGRAGSVVLSGTPCRRPVGQFLRDDGGLQFGPTERLDFEAELGFVIGGATSIGTRVSMDESSQHIFGVVLLNDWSARDIQRWESTPLGPHQGKSFATSISAWVTPIEVFDSVRNAMSVAGRPEVAPYLSGIAHSYDIEMAVKINDETVSQMNYKEMYWSPAQMLAHMTVNGAPLRNGDLIGSGTVSGASKNSRGSLLELTWDGVDAISLADGTRRTYLQDGDTVTVTAWARGLSGQTVMLGDVVGTVWPSAPCPTSVLSHPDGPDRSERSPASTSHSERVALPGTASPAGG